MKQRLTIRGLAVGGRRPGARVAWGRPSSGNRPGTSLFASALRQFLSGVRPGTGDGKAWFRDAALASTRWNAKGGVSTGRAD